MEWWKNKNGILQIYPRSYKDSSGDGVGDLQGIIEKLPYLKGDDDSINIDAIWLSPFYPSPMADFGYDVADYCDVDPLFGSLEDIKELLSKCHERDIAVMIDLVPNHTSDEHPWFIEAMENPASPKRDYYIFRDSKGDNPPNNWLSVFGGSAWTKDADDDQYYLHSFLSKQPDLNWQNPAVHDEFRKIVSFWCELGVDGFRLDAINWLGKHPDLIDEPLNMNFRENSDPYDRLHHIYSQSTAELETYLRVLTSEVKKYPGKIVLFESYADTALTEEIQLRRLYDVDPSVSAPFHFGGISAGNSARKLAATVKEGEKACDRLSALIYCFGNHDKPRLMSRIGERAARPIAVIQLCLPGIPVIYYGEEIGMTDVLIDKAHIEDPLEKQVPGIGLGRDVARTPMQWNAGETAGFTNGIETWLPVGATKTTVNVESEKNDPDSILALYKMLLANRALYSTLREGHYSEIFVNDDLYVFSITQESESFLIVANLRDQSRTMNLPEGGMVIVNANKPSAEIKPTTGLSHIEPWNALVIRYDRPLHTQVNLHNFFR